MLPSLRSVVTVMLLAGCICGGAGRACATPDAPHGVHAVADPAVSPIVSAAAAEAARKLGRPVVLAPRSLKQRDGWAFLYAHMLEKSGQPLDFRGTTLAESARHGAASPVFCALLHLETGAWRVVASCLGPTDVAWAGWDARYGAPPAIFVLDNVD